MLALNGIIAHIKVTQLPTLVTYMHHDVNTVVSDYSKVHLTHGPVDEKNKDVFL